MSHHSQIQAVTDQIESVEKSRKCVAYGFAVRSRVVSMSESGLSSQKISEVIGVDPSVIRRWMRRYKAFGQSSLYPYLRPEHSEDGCHFPWKNRSHTREEKDREFMPAYLAYATTCEPVSSISRRFGLNYHSFNYHVKRYHPELVEARQRTKNGKGHNKKP